MEIVWTVFGQMTSLLLIAVIGWVLGLRGHIQDTDLLTTLLTRASLPAMILVSIQVDYSAEMALQLGLVFVGMFVMMGVCMLVGVLPCLIFRPDRRATGNWITLAGTPNAIYMGQPVMLILYGEVVRPLSGSVLISFNIIMFTVGAALMSMGGSAERVPVAVRVKRILLTPAVLMSFAGIALFLLNLRLPAPVTSSLNMLGACTTPIAMLILGVELSKTTLRDIFTDLKAYMISIVRLVVAPVASWLVLRQLFDGLVLGVLVVASAMSVASVCSVLAKEHNNGILFTSKCALLSSLLSVVTAPLVVRFLL